MKKKNFDPYACQLDMAAFGERIRFCRRWEQLSRDEVAELLNVSVQSVGLWERGVKFPNMDNLMSIARLYEVTLDYLVFGDDPRPAYAAALAA